MKPRSISALALFLLLGCISSSDGAADQNIYENVDGSSKHTLLLAAIKETGLVEILSAKGAITLFAPNDEAFRKLSEENFERLIDDKEFLRTVIRAHVYLPKALPLNELKAMSGKEINGFTVSLKEKDVFVGPAKVLATHLCSNGVIHTVDTVLIPAATPKP